MSPICAGLIVPGLPHPLLCPDANPGYQALRDAFARAGDALVAAGAERLVLYSTMWPSVLGHQVQARPNPTWVHVDEVFHALGSIPYSLNIDASLAGDIRDAAQKRGLSCRTVDYHGFPIDTGSVVALRLLDPDNRIPATIVSSNVYADRAETMVLGKATADAIAASGHKTALIVVSTLSNRLFTDFIDPAKDHVHSRKDDEWNRKLLELLGQGRLEDTAQLSREIHRQVRVPKVVNFKSLWWLSSAMGAHNHYDGEVLAYAAVHGTGSAVVHLRPRDGVIADKEYDEAEVDHWYGDREVLESAGDTET